METHIAIVRLRGRTGLAGDVADTLDIMNLRHINNCVVLPETPTTVGMLHKAKDYITWGIIDAATVQLLFEKRGEAATAADKNAITFNGKKYKARFRLNPAKGGLGSRGIKAPFSKSGALGNRKEKIADLLKAMM